MIEIRVIVSIGIVRSHESYLIFAHGVRSLLSEVFGEVHHSINYISPSSLPARPLHCVVVRTATMTFLRVFLPLKLYDVAVNDIETLAGVFEGRFMEEHFILPSRDSRCYDAFIASP